MHAARKECNQRVARGVSCYFLKRAYRVTLLIKRCTHYQYNTSTLTWSNSQGDETIDDLVVKGSDDEVGKESKDSLNWRACTNIWFDITEGSISKTYGVYMRDIPIYLHSSTHRRHRLYVTSWETDRLVGTWRSGVKQAV